MKSNYKKIGAFVRQVTNRNTDLNVTNLKGININKEFMPSVANINGTDLSKYKVVKKGQFAFNPMHVGRDEMLPISLWLEDEPIIVSPAYVVFEVNKTEDLNPQYLMMWCRRSEFDRNCWFTTDNSVRGGFSWENFCDLNFPYQEIAIQNKIISEYQSLVLKEELNQKKLYALESLTQCIFKETFPNEDQDTIDNFEIEGCSTYKLGDLIEYKKGNAFSSSLYSAKGTPIIKVSNFKKKSIDIKNVDFIPLELKESFKAFSLQEGDILISTVGSWPNNPNSIVGQVVRVPAIAENSLLNQNIVRLRAKDKMLGNHIYYSLVENKFSEYVISGAQGSANQASVTLDHLFNYKIQIADSKTEDKFDQVMKKINSSVSIIISQNHHLTIMKDLILNLMSK